MHTRVTCSPVNSCIRRHSPVSLLVGHKVTTTPPTMAVAAVLCVVASSSRTVTGYVQGRVCHLAPDGLRVVRYGLPGSHSVVLQRDQDPGLCRVFDVLVLDVPVMPTTLWLGGTDAPCQIGRAAYMLCGW